MQSEMKFVIWCYGTLTRKMFILPTGCLLLKQVFLVLRWCEVNSFIGISNSAVASGPMGCQCCGWIPLTAHSKLLLPQDPRARTCLPGPALCAAPTGFARGGAVSVLLHQLSSWMITHIHFSLLLHCFCRTVSKKWQIYTQTSRE